MLQNIATYYQEAVPEVVSAVVTLYFNVLGVCLALLRFIYQNTLIFSCKLISDNISELATLGNCCIPAIMEICYAIFIIFLQLQMQTPPVFSEDVESCSIQTNLLFVNQRDLNMSFPSDSEFTDSHGSHGILDPISRYIQRKILRVPEDLLMMI